MIKPDILTTALHGFHQDHYSRQVCVYINEVLK